MSIIVFVLLLTNGLCLMVEYKEDSNTNWPYQTRNMSACGMRIQ